jgi:hypothetical protein
MKDIIERKLTPERIVQPGWGYAPPLILEAAVKHRLFDLPAAPAVFPLILATKP